MWPAAAIAGGVGATTLETQALSVAPPPFRTVWAAGAIVGVTVLGSCAEGQEDGRDEVGGRKFHGHNDDSFEFQTGNKTF